MNIITPKDAVSQICLLMKRDYESLGFLPRGGVEEAWNEGRVILQKEGREIYGYLLHGPIRPGYAVNIVQTYIDVDARRLGAGRIAFFELIDKAKRGMAVRIRLRCAEELPSNLFWLAMGCRHVATVNPNNQRRRALNVYEFNLVDDFLAPSDMGKLWLPPTAGNEA